MFLQCVFALLTWTCKFTKKRFLVLGFDEWNWPNVVLVALMSHDWGTPVTIISDRDSFFHEGLLAGSLCQNWHQPGYLNCLA